MSCFDFSSTTNQIWERLLEDEVINRYHDIYLNGTDEDKRNNKEMLFLGNPDFDARNWIKKAFYDFSNKKEFDLFRTEIKDPIPICIFVKAYRKLKKKKIDLTPENIMSEVQQILGMEV